MQWTDSYHENTLCFTNNISQRDGGTHLAGFRGALTRSVVNYINKNYSEKRELALKLGKKYKEKFDKVSIAKNILKVIK